MININAYIKSQLRTVQGVIDNNIPVFHMFAQVPPAGVYIVFYTDHMRTDSIGGCSNRFLVELTIQIFSDPTSSVENEIAQSISCEIINKMDKLEKTTCGVADACGIRFWNEDVIDYCGVKTKVWETSYTLEYYK